MDIQTPTESDISENTPENTDTVNTVQNAGTENTPENTDTVNTVQNAGTENTPENTDTVNTAQNADTESTPENADTVNTAQNTDTESTQENADTSNTAQNNTDETDNDDITDGPKLTYTPNKKKSAGRIGAIQSLYSASISGQDIVKIVADFITAGAMIELPDTMYPADEGLYKKIVLGVLDREEEICTIANSALLKRPIEKQDRLLGYILKAGIFELLSNHSIDTRIVISEYTDIAHAFYEQKESGMINAVLQNIAKVVRD